MDEYDVPTRERASCNVVEDVDCENPPALDPMNDPATLRTCYRCGLKVCRRCSSVDLDPYKGRQTRRCLICRRDDGEDV